MSTDKQLLQRNLSDLSGFTKFSTFQVNNAYLSTYPDTFNNIGPNIVLDLKTIIVTHLLHAATFQIDVVEPAPGSPESMVFLARITSLSRYLMEWGTEPDLAMEYIKQIRSYYRSLNN